MDLECCVSALVLEALIDQTWISDFQGALSVGVLVEFLELWDLLSGVILQPGVADTYIWRFSNSGVYSAKFAYRELFQGATLFGPWERIWKSWAPGKCRFFMWLVAHNKCWTADRLEKRGLPHPAHCPLCDQAPETINHLLVGCSFARVFWFSLLRSVGLQLLSPQPTDLSFDGWWSMVSSRTDGEVKKGLNSVIILGAWSLWKHRNQCVFEGASPVVAVVLAQAREELKMWSLAGARGISFLVAPTFEVMLPEAIAIVMAPTDTRKKHGIFRLTDPGGMGVIHDCPERGFHPHKAPLDGSPIYEHCSHVYMNPEIKFDTIDLRER